MPRLFDDPMDLMIFASGAPTGLRLRVTNNGDGTLDFAWSGFNLTARDPGGTWDLEYSTDGVSYSVLTSTADNVTSVADIDTLSLGETYYFRVLAYDSAVMLLKTSNVVTVTLPEPWELSNVVAYLDADDSRIETVPGLRLTRAGGVAPVASPHYSAPHLSAFDGAAAMTLIFWKKEYGPGNTDQSGYIQQGWASSTGATIANGWNFCSGAYGGQYCSDAAQFRVVTASSDKTWYFASGAGETAVGAASCYALTFNAGTVRIWINGVERTLTAPGSPPAVLPTSSELLRIGRGYTGSNFTWSHASGYSRVLSDAEIEALTLNLDKPVTYAELDTDQKVGLEFHYEHGKLDCDHTANTLTAVSGGGTLEYTVVAQYEPVSGTWLRTKFGTGPKLDETGIFEATTPCLHRDAIIHATDYSRCMLTAAISGNPFTSSTNSWGYQYKPAVVATSENFAAALDGGEGVFEYFMPGYQDVAGSKRSSLRMKSNAGSLDGWLRSDQTMAANTAYTTFWHGNNGTFTMFQNGVEGSVTGAWSTGSTPNSLAYITAVDNLGTLQAGGATSNKASWKGYEGVTIMADPKLTSAQQAQLTAYFT